jgi:CDP-4-dehydro-6-deoxyglucose reductase
MKILLSNNKFFKCDKEQTIFESANASGLNLEHSCLSGRCRSCLVKVISGSTINIQEEFVLSDEEKKQNYVLSCIAKPLSDLKLDIEDLGEIKLFEKKIIPSKISVIEKLTNDVIKIVLRLPPNSNFNFNSGQYLNIIKGNLTRSYSIANCSDHKNQLEFFIKNYENGLMSDYFFKEAKINNLLRLEGPIGTFFLRNSSFKNIIFLATGTGIAPIKSILEGLDKSHEQFKNKNIWVIVGARYQDDLFWEPNLKNLNIKYIPVLSRQVNDWNGAKGYVQDIVLKKQIDLENTQVYACGSNDMINSAKELFLKNKLKENNFFSDAFVQTN